MSKKESRIKGCLWIGAMACFLGPLAANFIVDLPSRTGLALLVAGWCLLVASFLYREDRYGIGAVLNYRGWLGAIRHPREYLDLRSMRRKDRIFANVFSDMGKRLGGTHWVPIRCAVCGTALGQIMADATDQLLIQIPFRPGETLPVQDTFTAILIAYKTSDHNHADQLTKGIRIELEAETEANGR